MHSHSGQIEAGRLEAENEIILKTERLFENNASNYQNQIKDYKILIIKTP